MSFWQIHYTILGLTYVGPPVDVILDQKPGETGADRRHDRRNVDLKKSRSVSQFVRPSFNSSACQSVSQMDLRCCLSVPDTVIPGEDLLPRGQGVISDWEKSLLERSSGKRVRRNTRNVHMRILSLSDDPSIPTREDKYKTKWLVECPGADVARRDAGQPGGVPLGRGGEEGVGGLQVRELPPPSEC